MAVDIKTLRVGSHVEYKGKRGRILYVAPGGDFMNCGIHTTDDCGLPANYHISGFEQIHPIPITPELLTELGFEERRREYPYGEPDVWYIDSESAQIEKENNLVVPTIHVSSLGKAGYPDWWVIRVITGDKPMRSDSCTVRYLHEAESFLGLHNIELIEE